MEDCRSTCCSADRAGGCEMPGGPGELKHDPQGQTGALHTESRDSSVEQDRLGGEIAIACGTEGNGSCDVRDRIAAEPSSERISL